MHGDLVPVCVPRCRYLTDERADAVIGSAPRRAEAGRPEARVGPSGARPLDRCTDMKFYAEQVTRGATLLCGQRCPSCGSKQLWLCDFTSARSCIPATYRRFDAVCSAQELPTVRRRIPIARETFGCAILIRARSRCVAAGGFCSPARHRRPSAYREPSCATGGWSMRAHG